MKRAKKHYPACGDVVVHPVHGEATVCLVDTSYAKGRGWIHCNVGNCGGFGCYADEVQQVEQSVLCKEVA